MSAGFPFSDRPLVIYDGECPFCSAYVRMYRLQQSLGKLELVNARDLGAAQRAALTGYDLDEGMVLTMGGRVYHGADAVHALALMSSRSGIFNRLNATIFRSRHAARILYPVLRLGRALTLRALGVRKITDAPS